MILKTLKGITFPSLFSGRLCLDFTNTLDNRTGERRKDFLMDFSSFIAWRLYTKSLSEKTAQSYLTIAKRQPEAAAKVFHLTINVRETMYRTFESVAKDKRPNEQDLLLLGQTYQQTLGYARLEPNEQAYTWELDENAEADLKSILWSVLHSAVTLLTQEDITRLKQCPGVDGCRGLFFDDSKNRSRRWCRMEDCGSKAKMREQYRRKHQK